MSPKTLALLAAVVITLAAVTVVMTPSGTSADKGGCPNAGAANGAAHADPNSAHGPDKQQDRNCAVDTTPNTVAPPPTPSPTPSPTPTPTPDPTPTPTPEPAPTPTPSPTPEPTPTPGPTPVPSTDSKVVSVTVNSPALGTTGVSFLVSGTANLHNNGPAAGVLVNTTFTLVLPSGCTSPNNLTVTVFNRNLPASITVQVTRSWNVVCSTVSEHTFTVNASTAISPGQAWVEANPDNNSGTGTDSTTVVAPTPTPAP